MHYNNISTCTFVIPTLEMKVRKLSTSEDVLGIQVGENAIVLPTLDLQKAVNQTSGKIIIMT